MNIVFLTLGYPADINTRGIYTDLVTSLFRLGHTVTVFTQCEIGNKNIEKAESGATVIPVYTGKVTKISFVKKGINLILLEKRFYKAVKEYCKGDIDLLLYSTPPITFCSAVKKIKGQYKCKTYLLLKDIFPQNAVDLRLFSSKSLLYFYFRRKEKLLYKLSDLIGCMSPANVRYIIKHNKYLELSKVHISPNCIIARDTIPTAACHNGLKLIYGGNLGKPQGIEFLIECCKIIEQTEDAVFTVIGSGTEYSKLENAIKKYGLKKTKLLPFMPKSAYLKLLAEQDMGMIFLDSAFTIPNFPSRMLDYLDNALPIFACTDKNSDVKQEICDEGAGVWCESNSISDFSILLNKICMDKSILLPMKQKAREVLMQKYNAEKEAKKICEKVFALK
ncbi:MAG: glycosyltransferase family 4 protein [Oscillospiraceae bacterium]|nr:glycosyltransferase family 4 protein [Oscillospiraceae bacterium]